MEKTPLSYQQVVSRGHVRREIHHLDGLNTLFYEIKNTIYKPLATIQISEIRPFVTENYSVLIDGKTVIRHHINSESDSLVCEYVKFRDVSFKQEHEKIKNIMDLVENPYEDEKRKSICDNYNKRGRDCNSFQGETLRGIQM